MHKSHAVLQVLNEFFRSFFFAGNAEAVEQRGWKCSARCPSTMLKMRTSLWRHVVLRSAQNIVCSWGSANLLTSIRSFRAS